VKAGDDFHRARGGISGCQSLLNVIFDEGRYERGLLLEQVAVLASGNMADRFRFSSKGNLEVGAEADSPS
jgi:allantoinase